MSLARKLSQLSLLILSLFVLEEKGVAKEIMVYTYHSHPPFILEDPDLKKGITFELARILTRNSGEAFKFTVQPLPRKRLDLKIEKSGDWIVFWVNPVWFKDKEQKKFLWVPFIDDANVIISRKDKSISYKSPASLIGKRFGGIAGHYYVGIDDLVKSGKIVRIDGSYEKANLDGLLAVPPRFDVTLLPLSTTNYFLKSPDYGRYEKELHVSDIHHQDYKRFFMMPKKHTELFQYINSQLKNKDIVDLLRQYSF